MKTWQVALRSNDPNNVLYVNTFAVQTGLGSPSALDMLPDQVAQAVDTWLTTLYRAVLMTEYTFASIGVRELGTPTPTAAERSIGLAGTGSYGAGMLPPEVCMVVKLSTALATRSGRGRIFIPSPRRAGQLTTPDQWDTAASYWTGVGSFATALIAGTNSTIGGDTFHLTTGIWSRLHGTFQPCTGFVRRRQPHWLRSRSTAP